MQDRTDGAGVTPSEMKIEKNVRIPMRDGVHLAADIYRPLTLARCRRCSRSAPTARSCRRSR